MKRAVRVWRQNDAVDDAHGLGQRHGQDRTAIGRRDLVASRQAAQGPPGVGAKQPYDFVQLDDQLVGIGLQFGGEAHLAVKIQHDPGAGSVLAEAQAGGFGPGRGLTGSSSPGEPQDQQPDDRDGPDNGTKPSCSLRQLDPWMQAQVHLAWGDYAIVDAWDSYYSHQP